MSESGVELPTLAVEAEDPGPRRPVLVFELDSRVFACDVEYVREVIPYRPATRLPGAPSSVCGIINLRGTLVTVLDIGQSMGGLHCERPDGLIILVGSEGRVVGVSIDDVRDIEQIPEDRILVSGEFGDDSLVTGSVELDGETAALVDLRRAVRQAMA